MWRRGLLFAVPLVALTGCTHLQDEGGELPTLHMDARPLAIAAERPSTCTEEKQIEIHKGALPREVTLVVPMTVKADRAVPFWMLEEAVRQRAAQYCCDGVTILRAAAEPGDALFHEIEARGWRRTAVAEGA